MTAPTVYRFDDANAPVLSGTRGALIELLKKCLVEGYGTMLPAGWILEFESVDSLKAAFRNDPATSTGMFLQVDEDSSASAHIPYLTGYETMTDVDNGAAPFPSTFMTHQISNVASAVSRKWALIADERAFWFFCWTTIDNQGTINILTSSTQGLFFGDIITASDSDNYGCLLASTGRYNSIAYANTCGFHFQQMGDSLQTSDYMHYARNAAGLPGTIKGTSGYGGGPQRNTNGYGGVMGVNGKTYLADDALIMARPYLREGNSPFTFRGWMPGFYYPCHPQPFQPFVTFSDNGRSYFTVAGYTYYSGAAPFEIFISLDDWWI